MALRDVVTAVNDCPELTSIGLLLQPTLEQSIQFQKEPAMLVLSRHRDESIMIGDDVVITVVDIRGDKVRLGICLLYTSPSPRD